MTTFIVHPSKRSTYSLYIYDYNTSNEGITLIKDLNEIRNYELPDELKYLELSDIYIVKDAIYSDDNMDTIKKKIAYYLQEDNVKPYDIYTYGIVEKTLYIKDIFKILKDPTFDHIKNSHLLYYLSNILDSEYSNLSSILDQSQVFDYTSLMNMNLDGKKVFEYIPLSLHKIQPYYISNLMMILKDQLQFPNYISMLTEQGNWKDSIQTENYELLLHYGLKHNCIYVNTKNDFREVYEENEYLTRFMNLYFPLSSSVSISESFIDTEKFIHKLKHKEISGVTKEKEGIFTFHFIIEPIHDYLLPVNVFFKILHAKETYPFIKLNAAKNREKTYKLYADGYTKNGNKIPYISKSSFQKWNKLSNKKSTFIYINIEDIDLFYCDFYENGSIRIYIENTNYLSLEECSTYIKQYVNPLINNMNDYISSYGYFIQPYESIKQIYLLGMDYKLIYSFPKTLGSFSSVMKCLSPFFIVSKRHNKDEYTLKYKRVGHFDDMESIDAYIIEMINQKKTRDEIEIGISSNYGKTLDESKTIYNNTLEAYKNDIQLNSNQVLRVTSNPGYKIHLLKTKQQLEISIYNINEMSILPHVIQHIELAVYLLQQSKSSIESFCGKGIKVKEDKKIENVNKFVFEIEHDDDDEFMKDILSDDDDDNDDNDDETDTSSEDDEEMRKSIKIKPDVLGGAISDSDDLLDDEEIDLNDLVESDKEDQEKDINNIHPASIISNDVIETQVPHPASIENPDTKIKQAPENITNEENELDHEENDMVENYVSKKQNIFLEKLKKYEPEVFIDKVDDKKKFEVYSRMCQWNQRRTPVILTQEEKDKIDYEYEGKKKPYNYALEYGSDPDKKYYYICPRYWCLKTNKPITEEERLAGKCGGSDKIIPYDTKKAPPDAFIVEFKPNNKEYKEQGPGFLHPSKHEKGYCAACCFPGFQGKNFKEKKIDVCLENDKAYKTIETQQKGNYVKGIEKFPLGQGRLGYIPPNIQDFLQLETNDIIFRYGIENNLNQSFVGVIADLYSIYNNNNVLSINDMKNRIVDSITIDDYKQYFNGSLYTLFLPKEVEYETKEKKLEKSFLNFKTYILDSESIIDYTYLWDIVSKPHTQLFPKGLNLIIIEILEKDMTNNVGLVCPTNIYSNETFSVDRPIVFIMKKDKYFEPLYANIKSKKEIKTMKMFQYKDAKKMRLHHLFETIRQMLDKCNPIPYRRIETIRPIVLHELTNIITKHPEMKIESQIIHPNNKIIALTVSYNNILMYIPCAPSVPDKDISILDMNIIDVNNLPNYKDTITYLNNLNIKYNLPVKPIKKVANDGLIVGIIVETNQFIPINIDNNELPIDDGIEIIEGSNYLERDQYIFENNTHDIERIESIHKIHLETQFYNAFRNTFRVALHKDLVTKQELIRLLDDNIETYVDKTTKIVSIIHNIIEDYVEFTQIDNDIILSLKKVSTCTTKDCTTKPNCILSQGMCKLLIPKYNLLHETENEIVYLNRLADELLRYTYLRRYLLDPRLFLILDNDPIELEDQEMLLTEAMISDDLFLNTERKEINPYIQQSTFEFSEPNEKFNSIFQFRKDDLTKKKSLVIMDEEKHDTVEKIENNSKTNYEIDATHIKTTGSIVGGWKSIFGEGYNQIQLENTISTTFYIIQYCMNVFHDKELSVNKIKEDLINEYNIQFMRSPTDNQIISILKEQGKNQLLKSIKTTPLDDIIRSDAYYLTNLDLMLLAKAYHLPLVFFTSASSGMMELKNEQFKQMWIVKNQMTEDSFIFIRQSGVRRDTIPSYSFITQDNSIIVPQNKLSDNMMNRMKAYRKRPSFNDFIDYYNKKKKLKSLKIIEK